MQIRKALGIDKSVFVEPSSGNATQFALIGKALPQTEASNNRFARRAMKKLLRKEAKLDGQG
jgi:hypothetical protein